MSTLLPNYCGPHNQHYNACCPGCVGEWLATLSPIEYAMIDYRAGQWPIGEYKRRVAELRAMAVEA